MKLKNKNIIINNLEIFRKNLNQRKKKIELDKLIDNKIFNKIK